MSARSDFQVAMGLIDTEDPFWEDQVTALWRTYKADLEEELDGFPDAPDAIINPHFVHDGVRMLAKVGAWLGQFYVRHKATIDPFLDAALITMFNQLAASVGTLKALNNRGPT